MNAKEKAIDLIFKFDTMPNKAVLYFNKHEIFESAKISALICVDEMVDVIWDSDVRAYYEDVKKEIELL